jgi:transcriptional regulator GlxA family with amidase domain
MALRPSPPGRNVAVLALEPVAPFELSVACEVFAWDRRDDGIPRWDFAVCGVRPGPLRTKAAFTIDTQYGLDRVDAADLVIVPNWALTTTVPPEPALAALRRAAERGAWVVSFCTGAFVLAHAGLLTGKRATTHWMYAGEFRDRFPAVRLDPDVLYVADEPVMTSAGTAAAIDLCLHVVRLMDGPEVANAIARRMIVPPR